jgi:hypothetical protein
MSDEEEIYAAFNELVGISPLISRMAQLHNARHSDAIDKGLLRLARRSICDTYIKELDEE